jgi:hypothetical protein
LRILFDKNVPVGVRRFLSGHDVRTFVEMDWHPQLDNGELLKAGEAAGFDVMVTSDQNIRCQQNLTGRKLAMAVLGSKHMAYWLNPTTTLPSTIPRANVGSGSGRYSKKLDALLGRPPRLPHQPSSHPDLPQAR